MKRRCDNVVLHGAFRSDNFGDNLILQVFKEKLEKRFPRKRLYLSSGSVGRNNISGLPVLRVLFLRDNASIVLFCGGGYLGEPPNATLSWHLQFLGRHVCTLLACMFSRTRFAITGVGFGPLRWKWLRWIVVRCLNNAALIAYRDEESATIFRSYGGRRDALVYSDVIATLSSKELVGLSSHSGCCDDRERAESMLLVHIPGKADTREARQLLAKAIQHAVLSHPTTKIKVISDNPIDGDHDYFNWFDDSKVEVVRYQGVSQLIDVLAAAENIITTKLHVGICASVLSKRLLSFPVHDKTLRFYKQIRRTDVVYPLIGNSVSSSARVFEGAVKRLLEGGVPKVEVPNDISKLADDFWLAVDGFVGGA